MKFDALRISNFATYGPSVPEINFGALGPVVLITGKRWGSDDDSNGAGKSIIFEAICWALFNTTSRGMSTDEVIRPGEDSAKIEFIFSVAGDMYRIERIRSKKGKKHVLNFQALMPYAGTQSEIDGQSVPLNDLDWDVMTLNGATVDETQTKIEELVGMDFTTFRNSCLYGQGDSSSFIEGTDSERKSVFSSLIHMEDLDGCLEVARGKVREWVGREEGIIKELEWNRNLLAGKQSDVDKTSIEADIKKLDGKIAGHDKFREEAEKMIQEGTKQRDLMKHEVDETTSIQTSVASYLQEISYLEENHAKDMQRIAKDIQDAEGAPEEIKKIEGQIQEQEADQQKRKDIEDERAKLFENKTEQEKCKAEIVSQKSAVDADISSNSVTMNELIEAINLGKEQDGSRCPTCGTVITKESLDHLRKERKKLEAKYKKLKKKLEEDIYTEIRSYDSSIGNILEDISKLDDKLATMQGTNNLPVLQGRMGTLKEKIRKLDELKAELDRVKREIDINVKTIVDKILIELKRIDVAMNMSASIRECLTSINKVHSDRASGLQMSEGVLADRQRIFQEHVTEIASLRGQQSGLQQTLKSLSDQEGVIHTAKVKVGELSQKLERMASERKDYEILANAFPEIKTALIEDAIPSLEESINRFLSTLSDGTLVVRLVTQVEAKTAKDAEGKKKIKEKFEIWISDGETRREFRTFSGGEKKIIKLSIRLALAELSMQYSGKAIQHLLLDEVLGDLDQHKQALVIDLIRSLSLNFQILIISHQDIAKEKFDSILSVSRDEHSTVIIESPASTPAVA